MTKPHAHTQTIAALPEPPSTLTPEFFHATLDDSDGLSGTIGVAVHDFETGTDFTYNAEEIYPTASTLKVPLLYVLYRLADAGELDLSERVTLYANRVPGSGVLQHMDEGLQPTLRDLAELMIIVSDNWATDLLWNRMGKQTVNTTLAAIGMTQTSLPMTIFELFATLAGVDPAADEVDYQYLNDYLKDYDPQPDNPAMSFDARNDAKLTSRHGDVAQADRRLRRDHRSEPRGDPGHHEASEFHHDPAGAPAFWRRDRGGAQDRFVAGREKRRGFRLFPKAHYAIVFLSRGQDDIPEVVDRMAKVSRWVYDSLSAGD